MKSLIVNLVCRECGEEFPFNLSHYKEMGLGDVPKTCPKCLDKHQNTTGKITTSREELFFYPNVKLNISSISFEENSRKPSSENERKSFHFHWDGSKIDAPWGGMGKNVSGSLTFYSLKPFSLGDNVSFRHMRAVIKEQIKDEGEKKEREYEYVYLGEPDGNVSEKILDRVQSYYKTTLKGYGVDRNHQEEVPLSSIWERDFFIGFRSGRAWTKETWFIADQQNELEYIDSLLSEENEK